MSVQTLPPTSAPAEHNGYYEEEHGEERGYGWVAFRPSPPRRRRPGRLTHEPELPTVPSSAPEVQVPEGGAGVVQHIEARHAGEVSGARLLASDIRVAHLLVNDARYHAIQAVFGVRRDQVNLVTLIAAMALAESVQKKIEQLRTPTRSDAILGIGFVDALGTCIAGPASGTTPLFGLLVGTVLVGSVGVRALRRSAHGIKASSREVRLSFSRRYGQLTPRPLTSDEPA